MATGSHVYLALPKNGQLDSLHCMIIPISHVHSLRQADETVWDEVRNFKKCLLQMAAAIGRTIVFLEAPSKLDESRHTFVDCIMLPASLSMDVRGYYKKALTDCDVEWTQHSRIINTEVKGGLRRSVPSNFPYIYVDFRLDQGYVHVVEDEHLVGPDFLRQVTAGLFGVSGSKEWKAKVTEESSRLKFKKAYDPFDWTKLLYTD